MTDAAAHPVTRFDEPWQAELFALTVALSEAGHYGWPDWTQAFGATLARHRTARRAQGDDRPLDGGADYFAAWLETLEALLDRAGLARRDEAVRMRERWQAAYLATPHGQPVRLGG